MSDAKFKTFRHIETVRNYINTAIKELMNRQEQHDQSKLEGFEAKTFDKFTHKLHGLTYGSEAYTQCLKDMKPCLDHHYSNNSHHPEFFKGREVCASCKSSDWNLAYGCMKCQCDTTIIIDEGINGMNLIDVLEMLIDWKASTMRMDDGDIMKSIDINQKRFGYSDDMANILRNTAKWLNDQDVYHKADES